MNKFILYAIFAFLFFSCTSVPPRGVLQGSNVVGSSSDVFLFLPIGANRELIKKLLPEHKYVDKLLDRTSFVYLSLKIKNKDSIVDGSANALLEEIEESEDDVIIEEDEWDEENEKEESEEIEENEMREENEVREKNNEKEKIESIEEPPIMEEEDNKNILELLSYDICAIGRYPTSVAPFIFTKKNGWQKKRSSNGYIYYQKDGKKDSFGRPSFIFSSIPTSDIILFSYNATNECNMENLLDRVEKPKRVYFDRDFELSIQQNDPTSDVAIFVSNPPFFLSKLIGLDLDLPIETLKVYLNKDVKKIKEFYNYKIILQMKNENADFATRLLLSKLLKTKVKIENDSIIVEKSRLSSERLLEIIKKVILGNENSF